MGPGQPEFTNYESPGSTDMVNMTTGDFTYNIPILDVPGPEQGFSIPLTYRAGIRLEQEASWVGLGWSLNPGAIARGLNGYPDDISGDQYTSTYRKDIGRGWYGGVPGVLDLAWDSETGHSGTADLLGLATVGWEQGKINSGGLVGVKYTKGKGISADPVAMVGAALTIASFGSSSAVSAAAKGAQTAQKSMSLGAKVATNFGIGVASGLAAGMLGRAGGVGAGFSQPTMKKEKRFLHTNYWIFYNDTKDEKMYGSLYFQDLSKDISYSTNQGEQDAPLIYNSSYWNTPQKARVFNYYYNNGSNGTITREMGADIHQESKPTDDGNYWETSMRPVSVAHDDFSVMGAGVSGSIRPYRLEVGSVATPKKGTEIHYKYSVTPFLDDYKVPFRYENSAANTYDYHQQPGANGAGDIGIGFSSTQEEAGGLVLQDDRLKSRYTTALSTAPARKGIHSPTASDPAQRGRALVQGKHVAWYSNDEILQQYANSTEGNGAMLEHYKPTARYAKSYEPTGATRTVCTDDYGSNERCWEEPIYDSLTTSTLVNNPWRVTLPGKGIGAFAVTAEDGTTYHYSLPIYHYSTFTKSVEKNPTQGSAGVATTITGSPYSDYAYATTWLLTAITSSDYVDRGDKGVVDDKDWGGWVKFDYGKFSSHYKWRQPYVGTSYTEEDNSANFMEGHKQTYYLNSIRTRTHTALFVKSARTDARGHFSPSGTTNLRRNERAPSSSLRLDEIIILNNEDLAKLRISNGIRQPGDNTDLPAFGENTANNAQVADGELRNDDTYRYVLDQHDIESDARIRTFLNERALKRTVFHYSYRLCPGTPNSFANLAQLPSLDPSQATLGRSGKLTLESISTYGPQNTKLIPDYVFHYGVNPGYGIEKWDGFGMYNSGGYAGKSNHAVSSSFSQASADGAAWSLTEIVTPLGSRTQISYERDQYAHVSEFGTAKFEFSNTDCSTTLQVKNFYGNLQDYIRPNDKLRLTGQAGYQAECSEQTEDQAGNPYWTTSYPQCPYLYQDQEVTVQSVGTNTITLNPENAPSPCGDIGNMCSSYYPTGMSVSTLLPLIRNGGDIRVAAVTTLDENNTAYQVRYRYQQAISTLPALNSSGVIAKEPEFVKREPREFDGWYDYPSTPVMYGKVTVLRGQFANNNDADHDQREEFSFFTPASTMVRITPGNVYSGDYLGRIPYKYTDRNGTEYIRRYLERRNNRTTVDVGKLGQPQAIRKYNRRGELEFTSTFGYSNTLLNTDGIAGQGKFTEGVMTNEMLQRTHYRVNRSTKEYIPTILASTTTVANNMKVTTFNDVYDFLTGQLVETRVKNSLGDEYVTKTVLAYTLAPYAAMGPKSDQPGNRNMLSQEAGTYVYKRTGSKNSLVSAGLQTWKANWETYRTYNASTDRYENSSGPRPIWRQYESFVWNGSRLNPDGTYAGFVEFDWSRLYPDGQNAGWLRTGLTTRYDQYSRPTESRDLNGQYMTSKSGYDLTKTLATAPNARYTEIAYSGAEDEFQPVEGNSSIRYFGGEVRNNATRDTIHHTGQYSSKMTGGQQGFTYRGTAGSNQDFTAGRSYQLSAWVHKSDVATRGGQLYATLNGTSLGTASIASTSTKKAGDWYLLNLLIQVPVTATNQELIVGCRNIGTGTVYMDDFRFHPVTSPMTAYTYDLHTGQITYVLNNDNLFTHYQYDAAGKIIRVYKEVLDRPNESVNAKRLVTENRYNYAHMRTPNWVRTGQAECVANADGSPTGYRRYRIRDVNTQSPTYNALDWEQGEYTEDCPPCSGYHRKWINGQCETAVESGCVGGQYLGNGVYQNTYRYYYSDNSYFDEARNEGGYCTSGGYDQNLTGASKTSAASRILAPQLPAANTKISQAKK
ncbi:hypothetical protein GCM10011378_39480 [Hymenobacter glacieicola]|uniref:Uncharacterized protein n=2 Tax=Hymenobacter glacieicola TaxID=1562124 RepID=A0ABQ1X4I5_9BACT|nr:hypothetical protein GCM10011378_39480 [Hymenobacter glacieicola]